MCTLCLTVDYKGDAAQRPGPVPSASGGEAPSKKLPSSSLEAGVTREEAAQGVTSPMSATSEKTVSVVDAPAEDLPSEDSLPFKITTLDTRQRRWAEQCGSPRQRHDKVVAPGQLRIPLNKSAFPPTCRVFFDVEAAAEIMPPDSQVPALDGLEIVLTLPDGNTRPVQYMVARRADRPKNASRFWSSASWKPVAAKLKVQLGDILLLTRGESDRRFMHLAIEYGSGERESLAQESRLKTSSRVIPSNNQTAASALLSLFTRGHVDSDAAETAPITASHPPTVQLNSSTQLEWARSRWQPLIDTLHEAGPLSTTLRLGGNIHMKECASGRTMGRLEIHRITAAGVFPTHLQADTTLVTLDIADTGQKVEVAFATYECAGKVPKHYILESSWKKVVAMLGEVSCDTR